MKTQLTVLGIILFSAIAAKAQNSSNYRDSINILFSELNQNEITTGILLDRASPYIDLAVITLKMSF